MISWILVVAEIVAMIAIFEILDGNPVQRKVLLWFFVLSIPVACLALYLAEESSKLMQVLCCLVSMSSYMRYDDLTKKKKKK